MRYLLSEKADKFEAERHSRFLRTKIEGMVQRVRAIVRIELKNEKVNPVVRKRLMITPERFMETMVVKISLASLFRRYRNVRLRTLHECYEIVKKNTSKDQNIKDIAELLMADGQTDNASRKRMVGKK